MTTTRAPKLCAFPNCGQPTNGVKVSPPSAPVAVEPIFPDQTCIECGIEHPGADAKSAHGLRYNESGPGGWWNTRRSLTHSLDLTKEGLMPNPICSVPACDRPVKTGGMCLTHYIRNLRNGHPGPSPIRRNRMRKTTSERFWEKVDRRGPHECWPWTAQVWGHYGRFWDPARGREVQSHRFAYELAVGQIADGLVIDHICHNQLCVNPAHMRQASLKENAENARASRRSTTGVRGVHPTCKGDGKFRAIASHNGKQYSAGTFDTIAEAAVAVAELRARLHSPAVPDLAPCSQPDLFGEPA